MPQKAEIAATLPKPAMTTSQSAGPEVRPVKEVSPDENCMAAKPKEVDRPRMVAMIASNSMTTPAPPRDHSGNMSTVASRKVRVLPRLWCE